MILSDGFLIYFVVFQEKIHEQHMCLHLNKAHKWQMLVVLFGLNSAMKLQDRNHVHVHVVLFQAQTNQPRKIEELPGPPIEARQETAIEALFNAEMRLIIIKLQGLCSFFTHMSAKQLALGMTVQELISVCNTTIWQGSSLIFG